MASRPNPKDEALTKLIGLKFHQFVAYKVMMDQDSPEQSVSRAEKAWAYLRDRYVTGIP